MNVSIHFPSDIETSLRREAAAAGQDVATFVRQVVTERLAEEASPPSGIGVPPMIFSHGQDARATGSASHDDFLAKLRAIVAMHPPSGGSLDDSRESIYAGRE